jgi:GT2 family glycosyltransferase
MNTLQSPVLISIVTRNDECFLEKCLNSLESQTVPVYVKVFDNASSDRSVSIARSCGVEVTRSGANLGFSGGHNRNILTEDFEFVLFLNADVILELNYLHHLIGAMTLDKEIGIAGGKLLRMDQEGKGLVREGRAILDSTGVYFTPSQRHLDRGSGEEDCRQYDTKQLVFGITGAALLCRRTMLEDLRMGDEYLDTDFFAYREDADLAWRAQLRGWNALYEPAATALHFRAVLPSRRKFLDPAINLHSLKNRYLMRIKNMDWAVRRKCFPYMWFRDLGILAYVLLFERSSLKAYRQVWSIRKGVRQKRRIIQAGRRVSPLRMAEWFSFKPVAHEYSSPEYS